MAFATDRDILVLEPLAFRDLTWAGQVVLSGSVSTAGDAAEIDSSEGDLQTAAVEAGHVMVVGAVPLEFVERLGATEATVSLLRAMPDGPTVHPAKLTAAPFYIATFTPQLDTAHRAVLRMAGIDPDAPARTGVPGEAQIVNPGSLRRLEALLAVHALWAAAGAVAGASEHALARAAHFAERIDAERRRVRVELDLDGDGVADAARALNAVLMVRG